MYFLQITVIWTKCIQVELHCAVKWNLNYQYYFSSMGTFAYFKLNFLII